MTLSALENAIDKALEDLELASATSLHLSEDDEMDLQALFKVNEWAKEPLTTYRGLDLVVDARIPAGMIQVRGTRTFWASAELGE